ncbi:MAG TPA: hypothetical protein PK390_00885 [Fervidobacterium nodosum]|nr:hypothetical protein [Fervidobacterium nodosum]
MHTLVFCGPISNVPLPVEILSAPFTCPLIAPLTCNVSDGLDTLIPTFELETVIT